MKCSDSHILDAFCKYSGKTFGSQRNLIIFFGTGNRDRGTSCKFEIKHATLYNASLLKKGYVELEPLIAMVDKEACTWCDKCAEACPYFAIEKINHGEKEVAEINTALCKGCGCCVPICPEDALYIKGYTDQQIRAMIDAMEALL